ncbi:hypothetical protein TanjilG_26478 [Lupinus angustifolius]|uniref:Putative plant transposon protein domain-containing protein n=1 Tax=Lupinus angustifolius TaxID=3871 RepID=A0A1J7I2A6_LUPAN|nr:PREDICTED: uncharacterized protein LOC109353026 [Lupinus angustifolius]OIW08189.1 hypothetical protein TanjilG_26478 [Lupinus angustifolius]
MPRSNRRGSKKKSNVTENVKKSNHGIMGAPMPCNWILVKEFYANAWRIDEPNPIFKSYCRGKDIKFDSFTINEFLGGLENFKPSDEYTIMKNGPYPEAEIERELLKDGCNWVRDAETGHILHIIQDQLKPNPRVWSEFMLCNLLPRSNTNEIPKEHALLLYAICMGKSVDAGAVISAEIDRVAQSEVGELPYPSLITRLLEFHGVSVWGDDDDDDQEPGPATIYPGVRKAGTSGTRRR